ncbi:ATP-binding protein [Terricaulis sp.]|uniref:ATP-binding protein n=1 Tax=Terricaulis sp. TaxID=2768686 RepID=UPI003783B7B9
MMRRLAQLHDVDALISSARHNARFSAVRLPIIIIVGAFLWQLSSPIIAIAWTVVILLVERVATFARGRLIQEQASFAALHLITLAAMSVLWVLLGVLLWASNTEVGRMAAIIALLTTALYGVLAGQQDLRVAATLTLRPLAALFLLVGWHAWVQWPAVQALIGTLALLASCASVIVCAIALNRSGAGADRSKRELEKLTGELSENMALLEETSTMADVGGWRLDLRSGDLRWTAGIKRILDVGPSFRPSIEAGLRFYVPGSREQLERAVEAAAKSGKGWDLELEICSARGVRKWVRTTGRATRVEGAIVCLIGAVVDISHRVRIESSLRQAQRLESVGRLAGGVAHDFNNVLTAIVNSASLLQAMPREDARHGMLVETILKAAERANGLTRNLLAFSRQQVLAPEPTDLNDAITEASELLALLLPKDIRLVTERHAYPVLVSVDPHQLSSALVNLAVNARDSMPQGGTLRLSCAERRSEGAWGVVTVADTGVGIAPAVAAHIFDPFFTTKGAQGGTGLGLAMVHGFATQSGGDVSVESAVGAGTTFTLRFPLLHGQQRDAPASRKLKPAPAAQTPQSARVLLVDDDELVRDALALSLRDKGYNVVTAADGPSAVSLYGDGGEFDLVVTDVVLTAEMPGPQLVQTLRARNSALKTILVSGYTQDKLTETGRLAPGVSFLSKPFSVETLIAHMATLQIRSPQADFGF